MNENDYISFDSLNVGDYFYFRDYKEQIRRKVSIKKYIWISDGDTKYCRNESDEENATRWKLTKRHVNKCTFINFNYN